jgi:glycerol transport system substrate-binding protein
MPISKKKYLATFIIVAAAVVGLTVISAPNRSEIKHDKDVPAQTYDPVVMKWATLFDPSVLSFNARCAELNWFQKTALPLRDIILQSVGEDIETSFWESQYLARAFQEITGIRIKHDVIGEGDIVDRLMEQVEEGRYHYDIYVTDTDLIGTHLRNRKIVVLSDYMANEGKSFTNSKLDLPDFLNLECGQDYEGNQLQIPDYQFALVYWFRHDWFSDPQIKADFRDRFGYDLGVPQNWAAYEDIAAFFTDRRMKNPNDSEVIAFGHADYALPGPWLGWRFSDAFFSVAGMGDKGLPNGIPVDEWGIRVENKIPVGASVERGGSINGPAAVYGLQKWIELLDKYAPPESMNLDWLAFGSMPARGHIAQTWYWTHIYASLNTAYNKVGSPVCDRQGNPVWRIAPMPRGRYWEDGMKVGYVDSGSWTIPKSTVGNTRHAAWLWAQFCLSKTVAVKKFLAGATPVRRSTLFSRAATDSQQKFGGMIELLRSPLMKKFSDSGPNVPHYPRMSKLWWQNIAMAIRKEKTTQEALDNLSEQLDIVMDSLDQEAYSPKLNPKRSREYWTQQPGAPKPDNSIKEKPSTIRYEELLQQWKESAS